MARVFSDSASFVSSFSNFSEFTERSDTVRSQKLESRFGSCARSGKDYFLRWKVLMNKEGEEAEEQREADLLSGSMCQTDDG
jgi:hypothetical protein